MAYINVKLVYLIQTWFQTSSRSNKTSIPTSKDMWLRFFLNYLAVLLAFKNLDMITIVATSSNPAQLMMSRYLHLLRLLPRFLSNVTWGGRNMRGDAVYFEANLK